ncbi:substrate-binding periplasmic protein [Vibrio marisflavi]|uniref:Solute-binding protein family 3/N-terminal domain-containing protein n=1 Tax=Vibrio marisflavi CECT 7928 TaxID=634439 RepID=A0ABM8ZYL0_9VIBR|nr:transporter substrate-binding domain-containing protein [Vibrio marisflavi]CAH0536034.1 hypothetical protein VMF7928_00130 [Vibrio marisflavi CECT 7928]
MRGFLIIALLSFNILSAEVSASKNSTSTDVIVKVCDDASEWPPYTFWQRENGQINKDKLSGASIEVLEEIANLTGIKFDVELTSWKRCLLEVKKNGKFEVFMDGQFNEERAKDYFITSPVYFTSAGYWYSTDKYPDGLRIETFAELRNYNLCGVLGYNYKGYGFPNSEGIDTGAASLQKALEKVALGRCDLLLQSAPVPYGFSAIGENIIPEGVVPHKIIEASPGGYRIFVSKRSPRAYELLTKINQAVIILGSRGVIEDIMRKYLPSCGRNC